MNNMLYAVAVLGGTGIVFGVLLALASKYFAIESDPRVETIREILPGANCGACGYAGCSNYAEAVVEGKAPLNACIPGGSQCAREIAAVMGQSVEEVAPLAAVVFCIGDREKAAERFIYHGIEDCAEAEKYCGGAKACPYGCLGLGNCVRACPFEAISMGAHGLPLVDLDKCNGCGLCREACPRKIIQILPKSEAGHLVLCNSHDRGKSVSRACTVGCTACRICVKACPREAIAIENNLAVIDLEKCDDCGECAKACPQGTIHPRRRVAEQSRARVG